MTLWDDMSELEQLITVYSDQFKEVHGVRPTFNPDVTVERLKAALDMLDRIQGMDEEYERKMEQERRQKLADAKKAYKDGDTRFAALETLRRKK